MFWHTDNYNLTLEEPQLSALHGKKLKINVRAGWLQLLSVHPVVLHGAAHLPHSTCLARWIPCMHLAMYSVLHHDAGSGCLDGLARLDGTVIESPACVSTRADMSPCAPAMKPLSPVSSYKKAHSQDPLSSPFLGTCLPHCQVVGDDSSRGLGKREDYYFVSLIPECLATL